MCSSRPSRPEDRPEVRRVIPSRPLVAPEVRPRGPSSRPSLRGSHREGPLVVRHVRQRAARVVNAGVVV